MTDFFALLEQPRRPWLDADALKDTYHRLSALHHPDVAETEADFAAINRAYQALTDPVARLRHLLELELPEALARTQAVPEEMAVFFAPVAEARQQTEAVLKKIRSAGSPLAKALLSNEQFEAQERIEETIWKLQTKQEGLLGRVREADGIWDLDREAALRRVPELWQSLGYCAKWLGTLRETLFEMASI
jgi:curved DNA-binding protein CbpA